MPPGAPGRSCLFRPIPSRHPALLRATAATRSSHHTGPLVHHGCLGSWCVPPPRAGSSLLGPLGRAVLCATSPTAAQPSCHPRMDDGLSQGEAQSPRENPSAPSVKDRCTRTGHGIQAHACAHTHSYTRTHMHTTHIIHMCTHPYTHANPLVPTCTRMHTLVHTYTHSCSLMHTRAHSHVHRPQESFAPRTDPAS